MRRKTLFPLLFLSLSLGIVRVCPAQNRVRVVEPGTYAPIPGLDRLSMDLTADPCVDFYQYACGNFAKLHPLPSDLSEFDEFTNLREYNVQVLHRILEEASAAHAAPGSDRQKIGDYYASCMDTAMLDKGGLTPLGPRLQAIAAIKNKSELMPALALLQKGQVDVLFDVGSQQDFKDATKEIAVLDQGGLGLPEKDYYLRTDPKSVEIRRQYVQHLTNVLKLMGEPAIQSASDAKAVMQLETDLANISMGVVERRDPKSVYHIVSIDEVAKEVPTLEMKRLLPLIGVPPVRDLNVASLPFFHGLEGVLEKNNLETFKIYLRIRLVESEAEWLPRVFDQEHFNFYGRQLEGIPLQEQRWQRCTDATDNALGEDLGKFYVAKYFAGDSKEKTLELVRQIEAAMENDLRQLDWMTPETKAKAEDKLHLVANKIGYPEKWRDYSKLMIERSQPLGNHLRAREFQTAYELNKIGKPVDRNEWSMSPPTVNAYYDASMNDINFPAGILQPAFYDKAASDATNKGHIGSIVGHELTHGFDDEGRQFDGKGDLEDWWSETDAKHFEERTDCLVKQYDSFVVLGNLHVNGKLTLGENTADNGGLRLAFMAFMAEAPQQKTDGLTLLQHLFVGWSQNWCSSIRPELIRMLVQTDVHSPDRIRANAVVMNMPEFGEAFGCKRGQPMYPVKMCRVW